MSRRRTYALLAAACALPRLAVVLYARGDITAAFVDKGDTFARTFLATGTYGFIPGRPSAYTQPLYGFFLIPFYWIFGRHWEVVGSAHIVIAVATAWLVYEIGRRVLSHSCGVVAALVATLHPYLVWHDVHMNREVLDQLLAAAIVLLTLVAAERGSWWVAAALGGTLGVAILGNVRLVALPLVIAAYVLWRRGLATHGAVVALVVVASAVVVVAPWVVRNDITVGCAALTTDGRALWKANNSNTLATLRAGKWIDDVPGIPGAPPTPQDAGDLYQRTGRVVATNECAQMHYYRRLAVDFVTDHPGEKAQLAVQAAGMLWQPSVTKTEGRPGKGTWLDLGRAWVEPAFMLLLYGFAIAGLFLVPRRFAVMALMLLAYDTAAAMLFAGETRYRAPWDFLTAVLAAAALAALWNRRRRHAVEVGAVDDLGPIGAPSLDEELDGAPATRRAHAGGESGVPRERDQRLG